MAQKNITYDIGGKIKEVSGSYYDDVSNTLVVKNLTVNEISLPNLSDGIAFVSGTVISSSGGAVNGKVITWNSSTNQWGFTDPTYVDVNVENPGIPASSDISGTFKNEAPYIQVKSLSNVNTGNPLPVSRGGTGLSAAAIPNGESLLIGNGSDPLTFVTASAASSRSALLSNGSSWELTPVQDVTSSVEISIFTSSATWTRPAGTKMIRVLAQGGGGGGGSGANRNSAVAALGGSGGSDGGFIDSGIFFISEDSVPVVVGKGGLGAYLNQSGSAGLQGGYGYNSLFGSSVNNGTYLSAYNGGPGYGGTLVTTTTINGGAAGIYGENKIYDSTVYNLGLITNNRDGGATATSTTGGSSGWTSSSYYGASAGAGGGAFNGIAYDGGNGGAIINNKGTVLSKNATSAVSSSVLSLIETNVSTWSQADNIFVSSGGGGGAASATTIGGIGSNGAWGSGGGGGGASTSGSTNSTSLYDFETISLRHFDLSEATPVGVFSPWGELAPDRSIYSNWFVNGTKTIVSTGSVTGMQPINSLFPDGVLSSSAGPDLSSGWEGCWVYTNAPVTNNFTIESWFYLVNYGSRPETTINSAKCYLLGDGYDGGGTGILLGINAQTNSLMFWANGTFNAGNNTLIPTLNTWNHIVLQKESGVVRAYLNGSPTALTASSSPTGQTFGYSQARTINSSFNFNGYAKEFMVTNRVKSAEEIQAYYNAVIGNVSGSYPNPVGIKQGGDGGNGYVAVISYKY